MTYGSGNSGDYKKLKGQMIQVLDTDPVVYEGTWASGPAMNTARGVAGSGGPSTSSIVAGGYQPPGNTYSASSETFNGSAWTAAPSMNETSTEPGCFATSSEAAIAAGGYTTASPAGTRATAEEFDGSSWTEVGDMNEGRSSCSGTSWGTTTAGAIAAGVDGGSPGTNETLLEYWNGSAWSEQGDLNLGRRDAGGAGTQTAAIVGAGMSGSPYPGTITSNTETWNGSAWTEVAEMNNAQRAFGGSFGTSTAAIFAGGQPPETTDTESWDGTSWTEVNNMSTARSGGMGFGLSTDGYAYGDNNISTAGERFSFPSTPVVQEGQLWIKTATGTSSVMKGYQAAGTGAFASGGAIPAVKSAHGFAGTQTAGVAFAGATSTTNKVATSYEYNGTAWSNAEDVNTTRDLCAGAGTQTAAILFGGTLPPGGHSTATEIYDGTDWTTSPGSLNTARSRIGPLGTSTATLAVAGTPPATSSVESWNGTAWTEIAEINTARMNGGAAGIQTAGLFFGGETPSAVQSITEKWDGTAWTEVGDMNTARQSSGQGAGTTNTAAIAIGGEVSPGFTANAETYNGSSWTEVANLSTARGYHGCGGSQVLAIATGGRTPTFVANTEEWTVPFATKTIGTD